MPAARHPADLIGIAAARHGASPAFTVVFPDADPQTISFEEADRLSDAFAGFLVAELGLIPGQVLAVQLANGLPFPIVVFGAWKAGLIVSPVNPFYTPVETRRQLSDCGARAFVGHPASIALLDAALDEADLAVISVDGSGLMQAASPSQVEHGSARDSGRRRSTLAEALRYEGPVPRERDPVALYQYTGGTTGRSKAAVISADNLLSTTAMVSRFFAGHGAPIAGGTALTALPLYHVFAFLFGMLVYVEAGTHDIIVPLARPVANLRPAFESYAIDWMAGVDTLYAGLLAEEWFRARPPSLRFAIAGGAALRPSVAAQWEALVGPILEGYGLTETTGIVSCNPPTGERRVGSVGLPISGSAVRIVDGSGEDVSPGVAGTLLVTGPQVITRYKGAEGADAFVDGWFDTGDVAVRDSMGMLTIMDRKKDMILVSGFNVYPNEVEAVLSSHPGVVETAVVGVPDDRTGERVRAFLVLRDPQPTNGDLDRHCRLSLAAYKIPREFVAVAHLPKSAVGKILRAELRRPTDAVGATTPLA